MNKKAFCLSMIASMVSADAMIGTNIGGWQVLEPWITPSLFYRFLGKTHSEGVGMDQYTFCETLGPEEGNRVLRDHWDTWVTEDLIKDLVDREVEILRLPIGDWTLKPYGPYVGCTDGAADKIQWFLDTAAKYNLKVLLDVHCLKDSQNGFDNSGQARDVTWSSETRFQKIDGAYWIGDWNPATYSYDNINYDNIDWALDNVDKLLDKWGDHPAVYALEPVNEPWGNTPRDALMDFYRQVRKRIQAKSSEMYFVFQNAFDFSDSWNEMFPDDDHDKVIMDVHYYTAWNPAKWDVGKYCDQYGQDFKMANKIKYDIWVGEWSLATDVCAMWLGGFNDGGSPFVYDCAWVDCPYSYLPESSAVDFDRSLPEIGPFGSITESSPKYGKCPIDSDFFSEDDVLRLGDCSTYVFNEYAQAQFLWTARNELESKWNYVQAYDKGWLKRNWRNDEKMFLQ